ncbi:MAG: hypothetical protein JRI69_09580 [Deltaproteobacteria bacterium]|nr:hypothetical protein [Deltaproteobacteria bacterium]
MELLYPAFGIQYPETSNFKFYLHNVFVQKNGATLKGKNPLKIEIRGKRGTEWKISGTARNCKFRVNGLDIGLSPPPPMNSGSKRQMVSEKISLFKTLRNSG